MGNGVVAERFKGFQCVLLNLWMGIAQGDG